MATTNIVKGCVEGREGNPVLEGLSHLYFWNTPNERPAPAAVWPLHQRLQRNGLQLETPLRWQNPQRIENNHSNCLHGSGDGDLTNSVVWQYVAGREGVSASLLVTSLVGY